jgi:hypothetical protein
MKTVIEMLTWLNTPGHIKCVLADITEVGNFVDSTVSSFFLSNVAYFGNNQIYNAAITGGLSFSESLNVDGQASLSFGSLEIVNTGGVHDVYLTSYIWNKRPIKVYLGDPSWPKTDFVLIFDGLIQEITAPSENTLSFTLFDKLQRLNDPISERTLTSLGADRTAASLTAYSETALNNVLPLLFGEAFNIQPLLVDKGGATGSGQIYMVHDGAINGVIEVRDNGVPVTVTENSSTGTFTLLTKPFGTITCSAQGRTTYTNTIPGIITQLVTNYGTVENRFTTSEVSFADFAKTQPVGFYCNDRTNILDACNQLAKSLNANLICPSIVVTDGVVSTSKLRLIEIKVPTETAKYTLNDDNMILNTLSIQQMFPIKPSIKLGYCKNYTVQATVSGGVNPQSRFDEPYLYTTKQNAVKKTLYRDSGTVAEEETLLLVTADAEAEAQKRLTLWQDQRYIITADYLPHLIFVQLGDTVTIQSARFGLNAGKLGMVYSVTRNWTTGIVSIGVLV